MQMRKVPGGVWTYIWDLPILCSMYTKLSELVAIGVESVNSSDSCSTHASEG